MSADAKHRNATAATDLTVLAARLEKQKVALDAVGIKLGQQRLELERTQAEVKDLRARLEAIEAMVPAPK